MYLEVSEIRLEKGDRHESVIRRSRQMQHYTDRRSISDSVRRTGMLRQDGGRDLRESVVSYEWGAEDALHDAGDG